MIERINGALSLSLESGNSSRPWLMVDLSGQIKLGEGSSVLRDTVKDLLGKGRKKILLNLADINYIDSSGVGELVSSFTSVRNQGGELKLLRLTKKSMTYCKSPNFILSST